MHILDAVDKNGCMCSCRAVENTRQALAASIFFFFFPSHLHIFLTGYTLFDGIIAKLLV